MRWTSPRERRDRESGIATVEVVLLAPVIVIVLLVMTGLGLMANAKGVVDSAAADAARMGSLQRDGTDANNQAQNVADQDMAGSIACESPNGAPTVNPTPAGDFAANTLYTVEVECRVNYFGIAMNLTSTAVSPIDQFRETN